jgi:tetratricopeptide (TPR) repeat protein
MVRRAEPVNAPLTSAEGVARTFQQAIAHHVGGRLGEAEPLYREILAFQPANFDALHLLGVVCHQTGRHEAAIGYIRHAIAVNPRQPAPHSNLGLALQALSQSAEALESYDRAVALDPTYFDALVNRGNMLRELGRPIEAIDSFERALVINPGAVGALIFCGIAELEAGRPEAAAKRFCRVLAIDPNNALAHVNSGNALQALKRYAEALASYDLAIAHAPGLAEAYSNRGNALRELSRPEEALASLDRALEIKPEFPGALNNRGICLRDLNRQYEALDSYDRALAIQPDYADAFCNRGNVLQDLGRYEDALESYGRAQQSDSGHAQSQWNESLCRLLLGDFEQGWPKYESRWKTEQRDQVRDFPVPMWLGDSPIAGKTLLLHAEQGFGDTLQFCRYAAKVAALGARVVLEVQPPLKPLLQGLEGASAVVARGEALPRFDLHCPLLSLPLAFRTNLGSIPAPRTYLRSEPERVERWRKRLARSPGKRIGLVWSGSGGLRNDPARSLPLAVFSGLKPANAQLVCLQKEVAVPDQELLLRRGDILSVSEELVDFAETAALVELMDIVISVDTAVAHLAGAMGKPVLILLPNAPTWRWLLHREVSPWYPSARLFRASRTGDWGGAIERVIAAAVAATR